MLYKVELAKLTGTPDESGWSQIHIFKPEDEEKFKSKGELYVVISTTGQQEGLEKTVIGRELLSSFHEIYFDSNENAFNSIKSATSRVAEKFSESLGAIEVAALSRIEDVVYLASGGGSKIMIDRDGKTSDIIKTVKGETKVASGFIRDNDIFVLGTSKFFLHFDNTEITKAASNPDIQSVEESLIPKIHAQEKSGGYGVLFVKFIPEQKFSESLRDLNEGAMGEVLVSDGIKPGSGVNGHDDFVDHADDDGLKNSLKDASITPKFEGKDRLKKLNFFQTIKYSINDLLAKIIEKKVYVSTGQKDNEFLNRRKKVSLSIGIILLLLLLVSIGFGIRQKKVSDYKAKYTTKLQEARHELNEAEEIYSLNPERSRELFVSSRQKVSELVGQNINDPELSDLVNKLNETQGKILGEYRVTPELYLDLALLSNGFKADKSALTDNRLLVLDKEGKKIVQVSLDTKTSRIIAGPGMIDKADDVGAYADRVFILNSDGIHEVKDKLTKVIDKDWIGGVLIAFYGGNLYVLEKDASTIWRYTGADGKFSTKKSWLSQGNTVDISDAQAFAIDGSIWVLSGGRILKFTFGNSQSYSAEGVSPDLSNARSLFTSEEAQGLYVYDPDNNRVVVLDKEGKYKAQYVSEVIKDATGIVAIEKDKKLYLVYPDRLAFIELKHLQ